jgi:hypothetical protein
VSAVAGREAFGLQPALGTLAGSYLIVLVQVTDQEMLGTRQRAVAAVGIILDADGDPAVHQPP